MQLGNKHNVKGESGCTVSLPKGYKEYKIRVYNWNTTTIVEYKGWFTSIWYAGFVDFHWSSAPTWKVSKTSGLTYCTD